MMKVKNICQMLMCCMACLCFSVAAQNTQGQPRMPTQAQIDAMVNAAIKKMPTPEQNAELTRINDDYGKKYESLDSDFEKLGSDIVRATRATGFLLTKSHVQ